VSPDGVTLTDSKRRVFFRRYYPLEALTYCGLDTKDRRFDVKGEDDTSIATGRLFGFVAHKPSSSFGIVDNCCHLFAELDPLQPASAITSYVTKMMTSGPQSAAPTLNSVTGPPAIAPRGILRSH